MTLKRIGAAVVAVLLLLSCLPFAASAAHVPTELYVGEKNKSDDNLIEMYQRTGLPVEVIEVYRNTKSYYRLTKEAGVGYVLTFFNDYMMSEIISAYRCGLYCDGDLTIRIAGRNVSFDTNEFDKYPDSVGWRVDGALTIESYMYPDGSVFSGAQVTVEGNRKLRKNDDGSIGISAESLFIHDVTVYAVGGYSAIKAESALVMCDAYLYANTDPALKDEEGEALFKFGISTENFIQSGGHVAACGDVDIGGYDPRDNASCKFDDKVVVYRRYFVFKQDVYDGYWNSTYDLFTDLTLPSCVQAFSASTVALISGKRVTLHRRGQTMLTLMVPCGRATVLLDYAPVQCKVQFFQWIPYIFSFVWLEGRSK